MKKALPPKLRNLLNKITSLPPVVISESSTVGVNCFFLLKNISKRTLIVAENYNAAQDIHNWIFELCSMTGRNFDFELFDDYTGTSKTLNENENKLSLLLNDVLNEKISLITSIESFNKNLPDPADFKDSSFIIRKNDTLSFKSLAETLVEMDYDDEDQVTNSCEFALRGGIIDIFSPIEEFPARVEFFGDEIESIRLFNPETQLTFEKRELYKLAPRRYSGEKHSSCTIADYFNKGCALLTAHIPESDYDKLINSTNFRVLKEKAGAENLFMEVIPPLNRESFYESAPPEIFSPIPDIYEGRESSHMSEIGREIYSKMRISQIFQWTEKEYEIFIFAETSSGSRLIEDWMKRNKLPVSKIKFINNQLSRGFICPTLKLVCVSEKEIYYIPHKKLTIFNKGRIKPASVKRADTYALPELENGDYAVHFIHGIGIYHGITEIESGGARREVIEMEYEDSVKVFVPVWQAYLVSRYIGTNREIPTLNKIGSGRWSSLKDAAMSSAKILAAELLRIQALRLAVNGHKFIEDNEEIKNFESSFPFNETPDQIRAINDVKSDLTNHKPMDRLLCGDVGFGKTEVAMRAAFRCAMEGKQAAILAPTTVLAQQHYYTFTERFSEHPVIIQVISRFKSPAEQKKILSDLAQGKIDIIIGTHRLLQKDVIFADLGLFIIDEEQKFGVKDKERLKRMRASVDILTMTATPIPRTLYLALSGIRDLSTIETPPVDRLPIKTILCRFEKDIIARAVMDEVSRGGQVFFIHNRVKTIEERAIWLRNLLPDVKIAVGHGQMDAGELEDVMSDFIDGKVDVLVCSTIIESGVDIPNANTMIIERADMFGLAELYQLRGRVGRWTKQAFAYLLLPDSAALSTVASERLSAIRKYTQLGSGFRLALKDLEIRGTGNILGNQQSGHINAVGFNLYCQLLKSAVNSLKNSRQYVGIFVDIFIDFVSFSLTPSKGTINACLPIEYIPSEKIRVNLYTRASQAASLEEIDELKNEINDRFGPIPIEAERFFDIMEIRVMTAHAGYNSLAVKDNHIYYEGSDSKTFCVNGKIPMLKTRDKELQLSELKSYTKDIIFQKNNLQ